MRLYRSPIFTFLTLDVLFNDHHPVTIKAIHDFVGSEIESKIEQKPFSLSILDNTKTLNGVLSMERTADRPAADAASGVVGVVSWCPMSNVVIYDPKTKEWKFINVLHPNYSIDELMSDHVHEWQIHDALNGEDAFRAFIGDIPGLMDILKSEYQRLDDKFPVDYHNKPQDVHSLAGKQWMKQHRSRLKFSKQLGIPFLRDPDWAMVKTKIFDILHFGLCKSVHILVLIAENIRLLGISDYGVFIELYGGHSQLWSVFGKQWRDLLQDKTDTLHLTGPIYRAVYRPSTSKVTTITDPDRKSDIWLGSVRLS